MAISEKSRSALYQGLIPIAGEEAVGEMLSFFPARDVEEPVTKEHLRAELADVRTEIAGVRTEIVGVRTEMQRLNNRLFIQLTTVTIGAAGIAATVIVALLR